MLSRQNEVSKDELNEALRSGYIYFQEIAFRYRQHSPPPPPRQKWTLEYWRIFDHSSYFRVLCSVYVLVLISICMNSCQPINTDIYSMHSSSEPVIFQNTRPARQRQVYKPKCF
jgi:hypothetical protein